MQTPDNYCRRAALPVAFGFIPRVIIGAVHAVGKSHWQEVVYLYNKEAIGTDMDYTGGCVGWMDGKIYEYT